MALLRARMKLFLTLCLVALISRSDGRPISRDGRNLLQRASQLKLSMLDGGTGNDDDSGSLRGLRSFGGDAELDDVRTVTLDQLWRDPEAIPQPMKAASDALDTAGSALQLADLLLSCWSSSKDLKLARSCLDSAAPQLIDIEKHLAELAAQMPPVDGVVHNPLHTFSEPLPELPKPPADAPAGSGPTSWFDNLQQTVRRWVGPMCVDDLTNKVLLLLSDWGSLPPCPKGSNGEPSNPKTTTAASPSHAPASLLQSPAMLEFAGKASVHPSSAASPGHIPHIPDPHVIHSKTIKTTGSASPTSKVPVKHLVLGSSDGIQGVQAHTSSSRRSALSHSSIDEQVARAQRHLNQVPLPPMPPLPPPANYINVPGIFRMTRDPETGKTTTRVGPALFPIVTVDGNTDNTTTSPSSPSPSPSSSPSLTATTGASPTTTTTTSTPSMTSPPSSPGTKSDTNKA